MIERDPQGRWMRLRQLPMAVRTEMLIGEGWEAVVEAELLRLELGVVGLCHQLEGRTGHQKLREAVTALRDARLELADTGLSGNEK